MLKSSEQNKSYKSSGVTGFHTTVRADYVYLFQTPSSVILCDMKSAMVSVFTPWKLANVHRSGFFSLEG